MSKSTAPINWAQRKDRILLTVDVPEIDAASLKVDIQEQKITITAKSPSKEITTELNLWGKVTAEESKFGVYGKSTEFVIYRTEEGEHWPRLLSDAGKFPWLRVDWNKWVDEDEEDSKPAYDPSDMSALMGGMGGMPGMGGMGGMMGGMPGMANMMGGMGGMGMPDFGDMEDEDDEEEGEHDEYK